MEEEFEGEKKRKEMSSHDFNRKLLWILKLNFHRTPQVINQSPLMFCFSSKVLSPEVHSSTPPHHSYHPLRSISSYGGLAQDPKSQLK